VDATSEYSQQFLARSEPESPSLTYPHSRTHWATPAVLLQACFGGLAMYAHGHRDPGYVNTSSPPKPKLVAPTAEEVQTAELTPTLTHLNPTPDPDPDPNQVRAAELTLTLTPTLTLTRFAPPSCCSLPPAARGYDRTIGGRTQTPSSSEGAPGLIAHFILERVSFRMIKHDVYQRVYGTSKVRVPSRKVSRFHISIQGL